MSVKGVLISTFLSSVLPSLFFFTFTLQAERMNAAMMLRIARDRIRMTDSPSFRSYVADSCAAIRNARDRDWQMTAKRYLAEQRFHRAELRDRSRGKGTEIILHLREILRHIGITHR